MRELLSTQDVHDVAQQAGEEMRREMPIVWVRQRDKVLPAYPLRLGRLWHRLAVFTPFEGVKVRRVGRGRLLPADVAHEFFEFKQDPMVYFSTRRSRP